MALSCKLNDLLQAAIACGRSIGGVRVTYGVDWQDVLSSTVSAGILTAVTLKTGAKRLVKIEFDDDNTASYNQTGSREGNTYRATQAAVLKFTGITSAKVVIANEAKGVIKGLYFHVLNDGSIQTQGAQFNSDATAIESSYQGAKVNPDVNSNTAEGESAITYNIASTTADLVPTSITLAALEAMFDTPTGA